MQTFAFILESIGYQELILIGIVALIFLGPRKLPEIARKAGKIMTEFRATTNEFKATWEREVNFEEEARALRESLEEEDAPDEPETIPNRKAIAAPAIKEIDKDRFEMMKGEPVSNDESADEPAEAEPETQSEPESEKRSWL